MSDRSRYDRWPTLLRECAEELGEEAALLLAEKLGGQKIHVSYGHGPNRYQNLLGPELAAFLTERYGAHYLHIPSFTVRMRAEERRQIVLQNPDLSANDLAARLKVSSRWIEKIRAAARKEPNQPSLF